MREAPDDVEFETLSFGEDRDLLPGLRQAMVFTFVVALQVRRNGSEIRGSTRRAREVLEGPIRAPTIPIPGDPGPRAPIATDGARSRTLHLDRAVPAVRAIVSHAHERSARLPSQESLPQLTSCRVCRSPDVRTVLDLGAVPLANDFLEPGDATAGARYPLGLQFCSNCGIAQIVQTVDPEILFRNYLYTPSASTTWRAHCDELSAWIRARAGHGAAPFVVEPASNDGRLLKAIQRWTPNVLGVEPALNIASLAEREGVPTLPEFFGSATAAQIRARYGPANIVVGTNVLAHVPDIGDFLRGAAGLLADGGFIVIEAPYLRDLVETMAYDTIYHEHVSYLSVTALDYVYRHSGLVLTHVERIPIHGGSVRFVGQHEGARPDATVATMLDEERRLGYVSGSALADFSARVARLRARLRSTVETLRATGFTIGAYGATAKGTTLLTTTGLTREHVRYIVDKNPLKQGRVAPGSLIPIVDVSSLANDPVDILMLLAWNLKDEIVREQREFSERGGRFLVPIPEPVLI